MAGLAHLTRRFFGSLRPGAPAAREVEWVRGVLSPAEFELWSSMSNPDLRHSVSVAREVQRALGDEATAPVLAAALLHDVGKTVAGLRTYGRVIATLSGRVAGHDMAVAWSETKGFTRRVGLYLNHAALGGDLLGMAGSDPLTEAWAREHHLDPADWTVPTHIGEALKAADDD